MYKSQKKTKTQTAETYTWLTFSKQSEFSQNFNHQFYGLDFVGQQDDLHLFDTSPFCNELECIKYVENLFSELNSDVMKYITLVYDDLSNFSKNELKRLSNINKLPDTKAWLNRIKLFFIHALSNDYCISKLFKNGFSFEELEIIMDQIVELEMFLGIES